MKVAGRVAMKRPKGGPQQMLGQPHMLLLPGDLAVLFTDLSCHREGREIIERSYEAEPS